jgi:hypothetical protein
VYQERISELQDGISDADYKIKFAQEQQLEALHSTIDDLNKVVISSFVDFSNRVWSLNFIARVEGC